jgi:hypothetical protein
VQRRPFLSCNGGASAWVSCLHRINRAPTYDGTGAPVIDWKRGRLARNTRNICNAPESRKSQTPPSPVPAPRGLLCLKRNPCRIHLLRNSVSCRRLYYTGATRCVTNVGVVEPDVLSLGFLLLVSLLLTAALSAGQAERPGKSIICP